MRSLIFVFNLKFPVPCKEQDFMPGTTCHMKSYLLAVVIYNLYPTFKLTANALSIILLETLLSEVSSTILLKLK